MGDGGGIAPSLLIGIRSRFGIIDTAKTSLPLMNTARLLIVGYNCFAEKNRKESIDMEAIERSPGRKVDHLLNEWVMLSRSKVLVACGEILAARDEVLALLRTDDPGTNP